jgi:aspartate carbamoyltransferase regulatory subunit
VARLLHLTDIDVPTLIGYNLPSKRLGRKGIIKITNKYFTDEEISRLSVIAPNVVLNIIKDYEVVEKKMVVTPNELHGIIKCNNPKCITNNEPMDTFFTVIDKEKGIVKCHYCDKEQDINHVELV